ncbi:hypothetical protein GYA49_03075, partial [Candidatus Beckwithbacteria bacterium]|nr:hypothetical protein [Candidatus Beckwithbacteria bacterium]
MPKKGFFGFIFFVCWDIIFNLFQDLKLINNKISSEKIIFSNKIKSPVWILSLYIAVLFSSVLVTISSNFKNTAFTPEIYEWDYAKDYEPGGRSSGFNADGSPQGPASMGHGNDNKNDNDNKNEGSSSKKTESVTPKDGGFSEWIVAGGNGKREDYEKWATSVGKSSTEIQQGLTAQNRYSRVASTDPLTNDSGSLGAALAGSADGDKIIEAAKKAGILTDEQYKIALQVRKIKISFQNEGDNSTSIATNSDCSGEWGCFGSKKAWITAYNLEHPQSQMSLTIADNDPFFQARKVEMQAASTYKAQTGKELSDTQWESGEWKNYIPAGTSPTLLEANPLTADACSGHGGGDYTNCVQAIAQGRKYVEIAVVDGKEVVTSVNWEALWNDGKKITDVKNSNDTLQGTIDYIEDLAQKSNIIGCNTIECKASKLGLNQELNTAKFVDLARQLGDVSIFTQIYQKDPSIVNQIDIDLLTDQYASQYATAETDLALVRSEAGKQALAELAKSMNISAPNYQAKLTPKTQVTQSPQEQTTSPQQVTQVQPSKEDIINNLGLTQGSIITYKGKDYIVKKADKDSKFITLQGAQADNVVISKSILANDTTLTVKNLTDTAKSDAISDIKSQFGKFIDTITKPSKLAQQAQPTTYDSTSGFGAIMDNGNQTITFEQISNSTYRGSDGNTYSIENGVVTREGVRYSPSKELDPQNPEDGNVINQLTTTVRLNQATELSEAQIAAQGITVQTGKVATSGYAQGQRLYLNPDDNQNYFVKDGKVWQYG